MIVFSHANSFPASTYRVLFRNLKARGYTVKAIEKYGHDPRYPISNNWPDVVQQLVDFARPLVDQTGEPVWLIGHSLGGFLSLMAASRNPELARGVVLVDSPILGGWRSTAVGVMKTTQMFGSLSPGAVSRNRRNNWPSAEAAFEHFRHKKAFAKWDDEVLRDYVAHGTLESDGKRILSFNRQVETQFYNTVPDNLEQLLVRHPVKCLVAFIGGLASVEMRQVGMTTTEKITKGRIMMLDGSHLFPMEKPVATAAAIEAALRNFDAKSQK
ncbi:MAG: alpha/beta hydrolase [Burkholderiales bacterium]